MNRQQFEKYIKETYGVTADYPWLDGNGVFRHSHNRRWFALVMNIPKSKLGINDTGNVDVANLKCDFVLAGNLHRESGFYPAYHMNKTSWISVCLDGSADDEKIKLVLDLSFEATKNASPSKGRRR